MRRVIKIYDTTLRDGTQGEGVSFSMEDKVRLATRLDALGSTTSRVVGRARIRKTCGSSVACRT